MTQEWPVRRWTRDQAMDLHDRLYLKINTHTVPASNVGRALLGCLATHAPRMHRGVAECGSCRGSHGDPLLYPCGETRLIADTLNVPPDDGIPPRRT